jgi:DNA-directed RNA polymerase subunit omega
MIDELRNDDIVRKVGGHFKLCALIQRRWLELIQGARPMVETKGMTDMEVIVQEIMDDKITLVVTPGFETEEDAES